MNLLMMVVKAVGPVLVGRAAQSLDTEHGTSVVPGAKGMLTSKTAVGILVAVLPLLWRALGWEFAEAETQAIAEQLVQLGGLALALYGRIDAGRTGTPMFK